MERPLIGANERAMRLAEDRELFKEAMLEIGAEVPRSGRARCSRRRGRSSDDRLPVVVRPSFTLGGSGGGAADGGELAGVVAHGLSESRPTRS